MPASEDDLLKVHSKAWIERVKRGGFFDPDTPGRPDIFQYATLSAGAAVVAAQERAFSMMRPPGHHAGIDGRAMGAPTLGFCYINNVAVAVRRLGRPTLIVDIDGHHGNGTQEIFKGDNKITVVSLHRVGIYPGTGYDSDQNCLNFPFFAPPGDDLYLRTLDKALNQVEMRKVEVVAISAGFDCHQGDLASLGLTSACFLEIGRRIRDLQRYTFGVLEGGYSGRYVGEDLDNLLKGLDD
jgi:acetoin utilization deacetylase AcuC-like enzyme